MRITYPQELDRELLSLSSFLVYQDGKGMVLKDGTPEDIRKKYADVIAKRAEIRDGFFKGPND